MYRTLEAERQRLTEALRQQDRPELRHELALVETRVDGLLVRLHTPGRGHPFRFEAVGREGAKEVREPFSSGYVAARQVTLPAHDGSLTVLPGHAPMVALLGHGLVRIRTREARWPHPRLRDRTIQIPDGQELAVFVSRGVFQVEANEVLVLAERGLVPGDLAVDDLDEEATRRAVQARILEEGLEGEALQAALLEAKRREVAAALERIKGEKPSAEREEERRRYAEMARILNA